MIKAEEISDIIKRQLQGYEAEIDLKEAGRVIEVGDGIARIYGLEKAIAGELLEFPGDVFGLVLNLDAVGELLDLGARAADGREQDVHAEGPVGEIADPSNLRAQFGGRAVGGGQHAKPSGLGHRRHQGRARHESHPGLAHRVADAEQIAERSVERAARERRHGRARPQRSRSSAARPTSAFFRNSSCASSAPSSGNVRLTMARIFFCRSSSRVCWISASVT